MVDSLHRGAVIKRWGPNLHDISSEATRRLQGREYSYVVVVGSCVTSRSLGNSVFVFINFNYRSAIKFSHSVLREKCRS